MAGATQGTLIAGIDSNGVHRTFQVNDTGQLSVSSVTEATGATNLATSQVTSSGTASTLAIARPTRTSVLFRNLDTTNSVYIGAATVTSSNGTLLKAGESVSFTNVGLIQVIAAAGTPVVSVADEYN